MSDKLFIETIFTELSEEQINKLLDYAILLKDWNRKINVISRKDIDNVLAHHILPCLAINKAYKFEKNSYVLDIGTGGGLPGIPLAISNPDVNFYLVDSIGKKISIVDDVVDKLNLKNVKTEHIRSENVKDKFDYIVGRSITNIVEFAEKSMRNLKNNGKVLYLTGKEPADIAAKYFHAKVHDLYNLCDQKLCESKVVIEISKTRDIFTK